MYSLCKYNIFMKRRIGNSRKKSMRQKYCARDTELNITCMTACSCNKQYFIRPHEWIETRKYTILILLYSGLTHGYQFAWPWIEHCVIDTL